MFRLSSTIHKPSVTAWIAGFQSGRTARRFDRHDCQFLGAIEIHNTVHYIEGLITEVSRSGVRFRPAKAYLLDRNGAQVRCYFDDKKFDGKIVASRPSGYGIALHHVMDEETIDDMLAKKSNFVLG